MRPSFLMSPILAFEKISKRFGAVVVAQQIDLALAEGDPRCDRGY